MNVTQTDKQKEREMEQSVKRAASQQNDKKKHECLELIDILTKDKLHTSLINLLLGNNWNHNKVSPEYR